MVELIMVMMVMVVVVWFVLCHLCSSQLQLVQAEADSLSSPRCKPGSLKTGKLTICHSNLASN